MKIIRFLKIFLSFIFTIGLVFLINSFNGTAKFEAGNHGIEVPLSYFLIILLIFSVSLVFGYKFWKFLWAIPEKYQAYLKKKRLIKAQNLILDSFSSLAAEQAEEAQNSAHLAAHLDPNNPLILLLEAKAAKALKDHEKAHLLFNKMLKESRLKFLGLYGLILEFKNRKDFLKVDELLTVAIKNRHDSPWVLKQILENDLRLINDGYKGCAEKAPYYKLLNAEEYSKHLSLQHFLMAKKQIQLHDFEGGRESLKKALEEDPKFLGAALELITASINKHQDHKMYKLLLKTAKSVAHPDLLNALLKFGTNDSMTAAYQNLSEQLPHNNYEVLLFLSDLALKSQLFEIAKHFCDQAIMILPTERTKNQLLSILKSMNADLTEHHHPILQQDYRWLCYSCYKCHDHFDVICKECDSVHTIDYTNTSIKTIKKIENNPFILTHF
ncbi:MAG: hypothetical protein HEEMFOPI_00110 [Holosporales bacterium]